MKAPTIIIGLVVLVALGAGAYALMPHTGERMTEAGSAMDTTKDAVMTDGEAMPHEENAQMEDAGDVMMHKGSYEAYAPEKLALAQTGKVVLFFRASWCPTCRALDADIKAHRGDIPEGVTILDVDYDKSTALKQKYGVTMQHTLVQVDANGTLITKWTGSPTLMALTANVK